MSIERSYGSPIQRIFRPSKVERTELQPGTKVPLSKGYCPGSYFVVDSNESIIVYNQLARRGGDSEVIPSPLVKGEIKTYLGTNPRMRINPFKPNEKYRWVPPKKYG